jgi:hypothetical protein
MSFGTSVNSQLIVTEVHQSSGAYRVNIGNAVEIDNIVLISSNGVTNSVFPRGVKFLSDQQVQSPITNAILKESGSVPQKKHNWRSSPMAYAIGDIVFSIGSVRTKSSGNKGKFLPSSHESRILTGETGVMSVSAKARCVVTFNNSLELTAYIFDKDNKRRITWPRSVKFKNYHLCKMIENGVMVKYKAVTGVK